MTQEGMYTHRLSKNSEFALIVCQKLTSLFNSKRKYFTGINKVCFTQRLYSNKLFTGKGSKYIFTSKSVNYKGIYWLSWQAKDYGNQFETLW